MNDPLGKIIGVFLLGTALALACVAGCDEPKLSPAQVRLAQQERTLYEIQKNDILPDGASDIKHEGHRWVSFTLERDGVKHRYLCRFWYGSHGEVGSTITRMD